MKNIFKLSFLVLCSAFILFACGGDSAVNEVANKSVEKEKVAEEKNNAIAQNEPKATPVKATKEDLIEVDVSDEKTEVSTTKSEEDAAAIAEKKQSEERRRKRREARRKKRAEQAAQQTKGVAKDEVSSVATSASGGKAVMRFENKTHEYGMIHQGDEVDHKFKFKNTGKGELQILNVTASCGCTQPSYSFLPIAPGEEGEIGVHFDSKGKLGPQKPTITVTTNGSPKTYKLRLDGFVNSPKAVEDATPKEGGTEEGQ